MSHHNILCLDGGGIRGVITTRILSWVEAQLQQLSGNKDDRLAHYFNFFAGTSTGGLMTACYLVPGEGENMPKYSAKDVEEMYVSLGGEIFSLNMWQKISRGHGITSAKYPARSLEDILFKNFGDLKLSELILPSVITAYDMKANKQLLFRSYHAYQSPEQDFYVKDVCRATTSAPTYFPPYTLKSVAGKEYLCIDGGIYGPNPAATCYSEMRRIDPNTSASNMMMLSLGTGIFTSQYEEKEVVGWGKFEWFRPMVSLMFQNSITNTEFQMRMVFRDSPRNYLRIDPPLPNEDVARIDLASKENVKNLTKLADDYIKVYKPQLEEFIEEIYNRCRRRITYPFARIIDVRVEKTWLKEYAPGVPSHINPDEYLNLNSLLEEAAQEHQDNPAFEQFGHSISYGETYQHIESLAAYLQTHCGIEPNSRVAIMMPNCMQYPISIFATLKLGAAVVNINPLYTRDEILHVLESIEPDAIIIWDGCSGRLEEAYKELEKRARGKGKKGKFKKASIIITSLGDMLPSYKSGPLNLALRMQGKVEKTKLDGCHQFNTALKAGVNLNLYAPEVYGDNIAFLQLTGGTTGKPKAAMLTHRNLIANILQAKAYIDPRFTSQEKGQKVALTALPLYHIFSLMANGLLFFHLGIHNLLIANPRDIPGLIKTMGKYKIHGIDAVNTLFKALLANPNFAKLDFSELFLSLGGGMAVQKEVAEEWQKVTGCVLAQAYGLTEASPAVTVNPHTLKGFNGSIGLPIPSTEIAILDEKMRQLPQGKEGHLFVRGPQVMKGYLNQPKATGKDLSLDNWLDTGDIAYIDAKGYVYIVDRAKDMIIVSGFNVYPNEVEAVVDSHPKVFESGCIGVPDEHSGEAVKVFVVLKPGEQATPEEIIKFSRKKLTGYKTPDHVEFVKELPKTNVGKILRRELKSDQDAKPAKDASEAA